MNGKNANENQKYLYNNCITTLGEEGMKSTMLQYEGSVEDAVDRLIQLGVFKTKSDVFRAGVMELADKYGLVKSKEEVIEEMMYKDALPELRKLKAGKAKLYKLSSV